MGSSAMPGDGKNIFSGGGLRPTLHGVPQRAHRQNGRNVCGHQQFCCRFCGACRVLHPKSRETAPERKNEVLRAVATERLSLRAAQRVFGVDRHTISRWLEKKPPPARR